MGVSSRNFGLGDQARLGVYEKRKRRRSIRLRA